jgi:hypothetical protein
VKSRLMYDAAFAAKIPTDPKDAVVAFYLNGGDPLHPWPTTDVAKFAGRRKLPIFVRSDPANASEAEADFFLALRQLYDFQAFKCLIALDIETAVDIPYVTEWGDVASHFEYRTLVYGSTGNLFKLPALDGRWAAAPGKRLHDFMESQQVRAVQNTSGDGYDESELREFLSEFGAWWI